MFLSTLTIDTPEMVLVGVLEGLEPATTYSAVLTAYTDGGSGSGSPVDLLTSESGERKGE